MTNRIDADEWRTPETQALIGALLSLRTPDEAERFLRDLCTRREIEEMGRRWAVARRLEAGDPYREIAENTGASTATITRINQWLQHGTGGYRLALSRVTDEEEV
jgi:TrpR-related protein YerC/YecD